MVRTMKKKLNIICNIAEQMLKSGAEIYRVEDSLNRMCVAIGAKRADVFIITSSMVITVYLDDENYHTQTRRINSIGTDMERLHRLNDLSRRFCEKEISEDALAAEYKSVINTASYPLWIEYPVYGFIGGAFSIFFGGEFLDSFYAFIVGILLRLIASIGERFSIGKIFIRFFCSFFASALAYCFCSLGLVAMPEYIIIGNIMLLIPGIGLTNALSDLFTGDSIAGLLRFVEAVLIALSIAAGNFLFITLFKGGIV